MDEELTISKRDLYYLLCDLYWGGMKAYSSFQADVTEAAWKSLKKHVKTTEPKE